MPRKKDLTLAGKEPTLIEKMKSKSLSFWGFLFIFAGIFTSLLMELSIDGAHMSRSQERAVRMGGAVGCGLVALTGIVLVVVHFVRRKK